MDRALSVSTFLRKYNRAGQYELVFGKVRPAVHISARNAAFVKRLRRTLESHLAEGSRGAVLTGRIDLVLSQKRGIVLHPPLVVVLGKNRDRLRTPTQVWGAPDIVLEVLTRATPNTTPQDNAKYGWLGRRAITTWRWRSGMPMPTDLVTWQSLGTLAGASGTTMVVANTYQKVIGKPPGWLAFAIAELICIVIIYMAHESAAEGVATPRSDYFLALLNGCLVF